MKNFDLYDNASNAAEQLGRAVDTLRTAYEAMYYGPNAKSGYESSIMFLAEVMDGYVSTVREFIDCIGEEARGGH
jgi:hypothetical protein